MNEPLSESRERLEKDVAAHPFLVGMADHHVRLLADCAMRSHFHAGEVIFREGEAANRFYLIEQGKVGLGIINPRRACPNRRDRRWTTCSAGHGFFHLTPGISRRGHWKRPTAIFFYGTILREYCEKDHSLGFELFKRMSVVMLRRLQAARQKLLSVSRSGK